jgi:hypothetical protein
MNRLSYVRALPALLLAAGCAGSDTSFPSLAPRAIEAPVPDPDAPAPAALPVPVAPAIASRLSAIRTELAQAEAAFATARDDAERLTAAAANAAPGSEPWLAAQQALTGLDAARGSTRAAQALLDELALNQAQSGAPGSYETDRTAIAAEVARAAQVASAQTTAFDTLSGRLRQP